MFFGISVQFFCQVQVPTHTSASILCYMTCSFSPSGGKIMKLTWKRHTPQPHPPPPSPTHRKIKLKRGNAQVHAEQTHTLTINILESPKFSYRKSINWLPNIFEFTSPTLLTHTHWIVECKMVIYSPIDWCIRKLFILWMKMDYEWVSSPIIFGLFLQLAITHPVCCDRHPENVH